MPDHHTKSAAILTPCIHLCISFHLSVCVSCVGFWMRLNVSTSKKKEYVSVCECTYTHFNLFSFVPRTLFLNTHTHTHTHTRTCLSWRYVNIGVALQVVHFADYCTRHGWSPLTKVGMLFAVVALLSVCMGVRHDFFFSTLCFCFFCFLLLLIFLFFIYYY